MNDEVQAGSAVEELTWWLDLMAEADRLARQLPPLMAAHIDTHGGEHELMQVAVVLAAVSAETRKRIQVGLEHAVAALRLQAELNPPHAAPILRVVGDSGELSEHRVRPVS